MAYRHEQPAILKQADLTDRFVSGFERIERVGSGCVRLVPFVEREKGGHVRREELRIHVVMPRAALANLVALIIAASGQQFTVDMCGKVVVMH